MRTGVIVLLLGLGIVAVTPVAKSETVPLADIKLIAEQSVPPSEVAAAARNGRNGRNGNRNGNRGAANAANAGTAAFGSWFGRHRTVSNVSGGELVAVDIH